MWLIILIVHCHVAEIILTHGVYPYYIVCLNIYIKDNILTICDEGIKAPLAIPEVVLIINRWRLIRRENIDNTLNIEGRENISVFVVRDITIRGYWRNN